MVFSSYLFLFYFLPLSLLLYYAVPRRAKHLVLTVLSYVFYGWANPLFVILLLTSTTIDYCAGLIIGSERAKLEGGGGARWPTRRARTALIVSLCSNLTLLGFFKYFNFGVDSYDAPRQVARARLASARRRAAGSRCRSASASTRSSR